MNIRSCDMSGCNVCFLPIATAFVKKIGVVEEVDQLRGSQGDVSPGHMVLALILDTLSESERKSLYRGRRWQVHVASALPLARYYQAVFGQRPSNSD